MNTHCRLSRWSRRDRNVVCEPRERTRHGLTAGVGDEFEDSGWAKWVTRPSGASSQSRVAIDKASERPLDSPWHRVTVNAWAARLNCSYSAHHLAQTSILGINLAERNNRLGESCRRQPESFHCFRYLHVHILLTELVRPEAVEPYSVLELRCVLGIMNLSRA